jgi:hypothetical protein
MNEAYITFSPGHGHTVPLLGFAWTVLTTEYSVKTPLRGIVVYPPKIT